MDAAPTRLFPTGLAVAGGVTFGWHAKAGENLVDVPDNFAAGRDRGEFGAGVGVPGRQRLIGRVNRSEGPPSLLSERTLMRNW